MTALFPPHLTAPLTVAAPVSGSADTSALPGTGGPLPGTTERRPLTLVELRALPDFASNANFELEFYTGRTTAKPATQRGRDLSALVSKYVLDGDEVEVTFLESVAFTVHDAFLLNGNEGGSIMAHTFNPTGDSRLTWSRHYDRVAVVKAGGNAKNGNVYQFTLRFYKERRVQVDD